MFAYPFRAPMQITSDNQVKLRSSRELQHEKKEQNTRFDQRISREKGSSSTKMPPTHSAFNFVD